MTTQTNAATLEARQFAIEAARLLADTKCEEVVALDVRGLSQVTSFVVIATGTSDRQMSSVSDDVVELGESTGHPLFRMNRERSSTWTVVDFVDVTIHLFEPNARAFYDLDHLWMDAEVVPWKRNGAAPRAGDSG